MRIACGIEYDGEPFFGFQKQRQEPTVQSCLEKAISQVANHPVRVFCAGRTDTGVSASQQVIHFETTSERSDRQWTLGINTVLHDAVVVLWVKQINDDFHARFSAIDRSYVYRILNRNVRPAMGRHQLTWILQPLDEVAMNEAVKCLIGTHDFSSFRSSKCQAHQPERNMIHAAVIREGDVIVFNFKANAFLHHMIRNIVGTLIKVGTGEQPIKWVAQVLNKKDRKAAGMTAPPNGLTFAQVSYEKEFGIPPDESN